MFDMWPLCVYIFAHLSPSPSPLYWHACVALPPLQVRVDWEMLVHLPLFSHTFSIGLPLPAGASWQGDAGVWASP